MDSVQNTSVRKRATFALDRVQKLAAEDRFHLSGGAACWGKLEAYLHGEVGRYRDFARRVVEQLSTADFHDSKPWPPDQRPYDEYGVALPTDIRDEFEVEPANWYVKLEIQTSRKGESLFFVSLHPLAYDMKRVGGELKAGV